jgi:hypothetical protein
MMHEFSIDSDPWQGGHNNNLKIVEEQFDAKIEKHQFIGFGITRIMFRSKMTHDEIWQKLGDLCEEDKIRGAAF